MKLELDNLEYKILAHALKKLTEDVTYTGYKDWYLSIADKVEKLVIEEEINPSSRCDACDRDSKNYDKCGKLKICRDCIEYTYTFCKLKKKVNALEERYEELKTNIKDFLSDAD